MAVNEQHLKDGIEKILTRYTKGQRRPGLLSNNASKVLARAEQSIRKPVMSYIIGALASWSHRVSDDVSDLLKGVGLNVRDVKSAIVELRKGSRVTSQSAEETYHALAKYATNLNDMAKNGKLDPLSEGTRRSAVFCRSLPVAPKTTRSLSVSRVLAKLLLRRALLSGS